MQKIQLLKQSFIPCSFAKERNKNDDVIKCLFSFFFPFFSRCQRRVRDHTHKRNRRHWSGCCTFTRSQIRKSRDTQTSILFLPKFPLRYVFGTSKNTSGSSKLLPQFYLRKSYLATITFSTNKISPISIFNETCIIPGSLRSSLFKYLFLILYKFATKLVRLRRLVSESKAETWNTKVASYAQLLDYLNILFHHELRYQYSFKLP